MEDAFTSIFLNQSWVEKLSDPGTFSGPGSSIAYTENLRKELPAIIKNLSVKTFLDAPCGDFNWMPLVLKECPDLKYIGGDIVKPLIEQNKQYEANNISFINLDITQDSLPSADLIMCRDCLFHLSFEDIKLFLQNFLRSDIKYLLTTSHKQGDNHNIDSGRYRQLDLFKDPLNFPNNYLYQIEDYIYPHPERFMYVWSKEQIQQAIN